MITKTENCLYCGQPLHAATAKKRYCNDKCRIYFKREQQRLSKNAETVDVKVNHIVNSFVEPLKTPIIKQHSPDNKEILESIKIIEQEKCPSYIGKSQFKKLQQQRINQLKSQLK